MSIKLISKKEAKLEGKKENSKNVQLIPSS